ncbi:MAG: hypothetical protein K0S61_3114, partial [Anaerocolumna sp.]|nr:hypothetical protein [Anaerocolumna sp.]
MWVLILLVFILIVAAIFFMIPYSKASNEFYTAVNSKIADTAKSSDVFTDEDLKKLPLPMQKYFKYCGYLGTPKMSYMKASFHNVDFKMSDKKTIKIDYVQYNFVETPERFAFIDSSLLGIPFEGFDSYQNGKGSMKGTIAKVVTLFDQQGEDMDKACLVTVLAECLLVPNIALQDYVAWKAIDDTHAKASISYYGTTASGIFTFDENGKALSFKTSDRTATDMKGAVREAEWS